MISGKRRSRSGTAPSRWDRARGAGCVDGWADGRRRVDCLGMDCVFHLCFTAIRVSPGIAGNFLIIFVPDEALDHPSQSVDGQRLAQTGDRTMSQYHRFHVAFLQGGQDNDRKTMPKRAESRKQCHSMAARIDVDNQAVNAVEFTVEKGESLRAVPA